MCFILDNKLCHSKRVKFPFLEIFFFFLHSESRLQLWKYSLRFLENVCILLFFIIYNMFTVCWIFLFALKRKRRVSLSSAFHFVAGGCLLCVFYRGEAAMCKISIKNRSWTTMGENSFFFFILLSAKVLFFLS